MGTLVFGIYLGLAMMPFLFWEWYFYERHGKQEFKKMTKTQLIDIHKELSVEVQRLSELKRPTPSEQRGLLVLTKLKLSYKDAIETVNEPLPS